MKYVLEAVISWSIHWTNHLLVLRKMTVLSNPAYHITSLFVGLSLTFSTPLLLLTFACQLIERASSQFVHLEKFSLNLSSSPFAIRVNLLRPYHPCFFLVYCHLFDAFLGKWLFPGNYLIKEVWTFCKYLAMNEFATRLPMTWKRRFNQSNFLSFLHGSFKLFTSPGLA